MSTAEHRRNQDEAAGTADADDVDDGRVAGEPRYHDECYACPVGSLFMSMDSASPDMMEHLLAAAHELLQVARSAIDAAELVVERQRESRSGTGRGEPRVHRIDLD
ncbi:MAG: hypothetical protein QOF28_3157 [Actinomycetota bacterium]|nr:hypothetical protein [Actinomycetota bacterium]